MTSQASGRARSIAQIVASVASDRVMAAKPTSEPIVTAPSSPAFKAAAARYSSGGRTSRPTTASSTKVPICASQPEAGASDDEGVRVRGPACVISPVRIQRSEQLERRLFQVGESLGRDGGALDGLERGHLARVHAGDQGDLIILRDKNALAFGREEKINELVGGIRIGCAFDHGNGVGIDRRAEPAGLLVRVYHAHWQVGLSRQIIVGRVGQADRELAAPHALPDLGVVRQDLEVVRVQALEVVAGERLPFDRDERDRKSTRLNSSHLVISYAV